MSQLYHSGSCTLLYGPTTEKGHCPHVPIGIDVVYTEDHLP